MWNNIVGPDKPQMTIWRMRITCWITKATDTHSVYVILLILLCYIYTHISYPVFTYVCGADVRCVSVTPRGGCPVKLPLSKHYYGYQNILYCIYKFQGQLFCSLLLVDVPVLQTPNGRNKRVQQCEIRQIFLSMCPIFSDKLFEILADML